MQTLTTLPRARNEQLVIQALPEETLVYDLKRHKAHCLNKTAAFVWQHCDGRTTTGDMAAKLSATFDLPADEKIVWLALGDLEKADLLQDSVARNDGFHPGRRAALKRIGLVGASAVLLPTIVSIVAPTVSAAVSCGQPCDNTNPALTCTAPCICSSPSGPGVCIDQGAPRPAGPGEGGSADDGAMTPPRYES